MFPADKGAETACVQSFESACTRGRPQYRPDAHRVGNTLQFFNSEVLQLEQIAQKLSCGFGDYDHIWFGNSLQSCCQIRRFADNTPLLRASRIQHVTDND